MATTEAVLQVRVLGEAFTPDDEEDSAVATVTNVWAYQARYRIPLTKVTAGGRFAYLAFASCRIHLAVLTA